MYGLPSSSSSFFWWVLRCLVVLGITGRWVSCQDLQLDPCQAYFNFESEKDVSLLSGKWITLGSTRRAFSCNSFEGIQRSPEAMQMEESWIIPGFLGVWRQEVTSEISAGPTDLEVSGTGFDGLFMAGKLAVGVSGNNLLMVQCSSFLWFPTPAVTVLSREHPTDPMTDVEEIFGKFNISQAIPSFSLVNHRGCERVPKTEVNTNGLSSRRSADDGQSRALSLVGWRIKGPRDDAISL